MALQYCICADCGAPIALGDACTCWKQRKPLAGYIVISALLVVACGLCWWVAS